MLAKTQPSLSTLAYRVAYVALTLVAAICLVLLASDRAHAVPMVNGEVDAKGKPGYLTQGPDGNVWVVLDGSGPQGDDVAKLSVDANDQIAIEGYDVAALSGATGIAAGPDDTLWVTRNAKVAKFSPANPAGAEEFAVADLNDPRDITLGPDGNLWAGTGDKLLKIPPANPTGYETFTIPGLSARGIASDGQRLWIASFANGTIYSVTVAGVATPHLVGGAGPQEVAAGLGGQVAYTNQGSVPQTVGRLTEGAAPLTAPIPGTDPFGIAFGVDDAYWFAQFLSHDIGRLTADGQYTVVGGLSANSGPRHVTAGPSNTIWVSLETAQKVARISGLEPPANSQPISAKRPVVSKLRLSTKRFRVGKARTPVVAQKRRKGKAAPVGTTIRFALDEAATARISFQRKLAGRRSGGRCVEPKPRLRANKRCTRWVEAGRALTRKGLKAGAQRIAFSGRIGRKALKPGAYRLAVVATSVQGAKSKPQRATFTIVAPKR